MVRAGCSVREGGPNKAIHWLARKGLPRIPSTCPPKGARESSMARLRKRSPDEQVVQREAWRPMRIQPIRRRRPRVETTEARNMHMVRARSRISSCEGSEGADRTYQERLQSFQRRCQAKGPRARTLAGARQSSDGADTAWVAQCGRPQRSEARWSIAHAKEDEVAAACCDSRCGRPPGLARRRTPASAEAERL